MFRPASTSPSIQLLARACTQTVRVASRLGAGLMRRRQRLGETAPGCCPPQHTSPVTPTADSYLHALPTTQRFQTSSVPRCTAHTLPGNRGARNIFTCALCTQVPKVVLRDIHCLIAGAEPVPSQPLSDITMLATQSRHIVPMQRALGSPHSNAGSHLAWQRQNTRSQCNVPLSEPMLDRKRRRPLHQGSNGPSLCPRGFGPAIWQAAHPLRGRAWQGLCRTSTRTW